jgi:ATP phosphoribosyltransferase
MPESDQNVRVAVPTGALERITRQVLNDALVPESCPDGEYFCARLPSLGSSVAFIGQHPRAIPTLVASGEYDGGITGFDLVLEAREPVVPVSKLLYNKRGMGTAVWALAVPDSSTASRIHDLEGQTVVSELTAVTAAFFGRRGVNVEVAARNGDHEQLFSGTAVVDLIETGETLRRFAYRAIATVLETHAVLIANPGSYRSALKRRSIEEIGSLLSASVERLPVTDRDLYSFPSKLASPPQDSESWDAYRTAWFKDH